MGAWLEGRIKFRGDVVDGLGERTAGASSACSKATTSGKLVVRVAAGLKALHPIDRAGWNRSLERRAGSHPGSLAPARAWPSPGHRSSQYFAETRKDSK